ncbi:apolipoprotein N-acyltransferase, partial [Kingella kingae]|nr:apolipoprotein N-acyltransferase [Kingella kingae]
TNTGATAIVSHQGSLHRVAPANVATVLQGEVQGRAGQTPYMRLGGSLPLVGLLLIALIGLGVWARKR